MDFRATINKMLNRIVNREDPDQPASSEAVWSGSTLFVLNFFGRQLVFESLEYLLYPHLSWDFGSYPI